MATGWIEEWKLLRRLGRGGYAEVWETTRAGEERTYAVKRFRNLFEDWTTTQSIIREAMLFNCLGGPPYFPAVRDMLIAGERRDFPFFAELAIVMERLPGDLRELMRRSPPRDPRPLLLGLVECVAALHAAGLAHRDLKPENFLVEGAGGAVRLTDFNHAGSAASQPFDEVPWGTRFYRAPELLLRQNVDVSADLWALGCVCAEVLWWAAGERAPPPFWGAHCRTVSPSEKENGAPQLVEHDQLLMAMRSVGRQPAEEFKFVEGEAARAFLLRFNKFRAGGESCFELLERRGTPAELLELLRATLRLHPERRTPAAALLNLPCFAGLPRRPPPPPPNPRLRFWNEEGISPRRLFGLLVAELRLHNKASPANSSLQLS